MALPSGITTKTVTVSPAVSTSNRRASLEVGVAPTKGTIVWQPTGVPVGRFFEVKRSGPDQSIVLELPAVDQPGFVDENQSPSTDWSYTITVRYLLDGRKVGQTVTKFYKPTLTTPSVVDFDKLPSGTEPLLQGQPGPAGASAYDVAVKNGFVGTEAEWLASLSTGGVRPYTTWDQTSPATEWVVTHNLGYNPGGVSVINSANEKVWAPVRYIDSNTLIISMSAAMSGTVYLS